MIRGCLRSITASRPSAQCNHVFHPAAVQSLRNNTSDSVLNIDYIVSIFVCVCFGKIYCM